MKVIRNNGDVIECSVEEYMLVFNSVNIDIGKKLYCSDDAISKEHNSKNEFKKDNHNSKNVLSKNKFIEVIKRKGLNPHRNKWTKKEEHIALKYDIDTACKMMPYRTRCAIHTRKSELNCKNKHKYGRCIRSDDKRIRMMKFITNRCAQLMKTGKYATRYDAQKVAMQMYRDTYVSDNNV